MASSSSSPSTAPVVSSQSWNYDVFLSFRGDIRKTYVDHLYNALDGKGIFTYKDDVTLPRGEEIDTSLKTAIQESQISLIVFSVNYANSKWCLNELEHIMKCRDERKQVVMAIFFDVEPNEVRNQKRKYKEAIDKHEVENKKKIKSLGQTIMNDPWGWLYAPLKQYREYSAAAAKQELENKKKVGSWIKALKDVGELAGWETRVIAGGFEAQGIKQIVEEIFGRLKLRTSGANETPIGITTRVQDLKSKLKIEAGGVRMIGIWGIGGGGKTTLASSIYHEICSMYDGCCFLKNVRVESSKGLEKLQKKILLRILKLKQVEVGSVEEGRDMLKNWLDHKRVLIILDDVDHRDQLKALVGSHTWFGEGSRIIITTRYEHLLNEHSVDVTHQISLLSPDEAAELFHKHAHRHHAPIEDFEQLSQEVVSYADGLPLALEVLGCFLCDKDTRQWRSALARLKDIPDKEILGLLRISFDGLDLDYQRLFLDIACFFRWENTRRAMELLDAYGSDSAIGVEVLRQYALLVITEDGEFDMHDLVQDMGHYIVRGEHLGNPENHSRVWKREDVSRILEIGASMKLDKIEAIDLEDVSYEESQRFLQVAVNMNNLRLVNLRCYRHNNGQGDRLIPPVPENFPPMDICCLLLMDGILQKQLWVGYKYLPNLARMELDCLPNLIETPDFTGLPKLKYFEVSRCPCLKEIHPSIGLLKELSSLCIRSCQSVRMYPAITQIKKLETLELSYCNKLFKASGVQQNIHNLLELDWDYNGVKLDRDYNGEEVLINCLACGCSSPPGVECCLPRNDLNHSALTKLDLSCCWLTDEEIYSVVWELPNLKELDLSKNSFSRLDFSILRLPQLKWLNVSYCHNLVELVELPSSIAVVLADGCPSLKSFGDISNCKWLRKFSLLGADKLDKLCVYKLVESILQGNN